MLVEKTSFMEKKLVSESMLQEEFKSEIPLFQFKTDLQSRFNLAQIESHLKSMKCSGYLNFCRKKFEFTKRNSN